MDKEFDDSIKVLITDTTHQHYKRLDHFLSDHLDDLSRSFIKTLFKAGQLSARNGSDELVKVELKKLPPVGTVIEIDLPPPVPTNAEPENIPLQILFQDEHLVIINKPVGMVTHPAPGHYTGTLVNAILYHCPDIYGIGMEKRPGIVHRLDKGTSGVMVVAKTRQCHEKLVELFSKHDINRLYEAIVVGPKIPAGGTLQSTIGRNPGNRLKMASGVNHGKEAITHYKVLHHSSVLNHVEFKLETGRTHQIRVHTSSLLKSPILMDPLYGNPGQHIKRVPAEIATLISDYEHPFLHAKHLGFIHPITKQKLEFTTEPPELFKKVLNELYKEEI